jgi:hypothetical protein
MSSKPPSRPETMDRKNRKTFEMSRKIDAARDGAEVMSWVCRSRWKSNMVMYVSVQRSVRTTWCAAWRGRVARS